MSNDQFGERIRRQLPENHRTEADTQRKPRSLYALIDRRVTPAGTEITRCSAGGAVLE